MSGVRDYSTSAGSNLTVGGVSIAEGMARASVNNAMRAQMADLANLLLDQGGETATTNSSNDYLVTLPTAPTAYADNMLFAATINAANTGASTLNVNSIGVKNVKKMVAGVATALASGDMPAGHIAYFTYSSANTAIILLNPGLTSVANASGALPVANGGTASTTASAARTALGLAIGTDVQAWDTDLDAWALRTPPSGTVVGTSDSQVLTNKTIDTASNTVSNIATSMFASNVVDTDATLAANSDTRLTSQKAVKSYVDNAVVGQVITQPVATATTGNITLSGEQTLDGVLTSTSRVLVWKQTTATENGIYVSAAGAWSRATDADTGAELLHLTTFVSGGSTYAGATFTVTNASAPTIGVTNITWAQTGSSLTYSAGTGLGLSGSTFNITDAELTALLGLTSAADKLPYFTGSGTAALQSFTSTDRSFLGAASVAAQRTTLGLATGDSPRFTAIELNNASDTTIERVGGGGDITIEGNQVYRAGGTDVPVADGGTGASTAAAAATNLGLGTASNPQFATIELGNASDTTLARAAAGDVNIEGNRVYRAGGTDVAVADGGTGGSTASSAATNLGLGTGDSPTFSGLTVNSSNQTMTLGNEAYSQAGFGFPLSAQDTDYTFVLTDAKTIVRHNSGSAHAYTIPPNASVAFRNGTIIIISNIGAGTVTLTRGAGVTLYDSTGTNADISIIQNRIRMIVKLSTNTWQCINN